MINFSHPMYDQTRGFMKNMRKRVGWEKIKYGNGSTYDDLVNFLNFQKDNFALEDTVTPELWMQIADWELKSEEREKNIYEKFEKSTLISSNADNDMTIPTDEKSSWQLYKKKLQKDGFTENSIEEMERTTLSILKKLSTNTTEMGPTKGLIIGHVQSGKTANMAALMAMAADWEWNVFIVLSGLIENLRKQTSERLINDLNHKGNLTWLTLDNLSAKSPSGSQTQDLILGTGARQRYLTVCLKHKTRLENLIKWLNKDSNKLKQMKIMVIDDEADQAGINSNDIEKEERAKINSLIMELVNGKEDSTCNPLAMNYISYTATPYANVLNEYGSQTLYPKDFIGVIKTSNEFFGPKEIFGLLEEDDRYGLDITRKINDQDLSLINDIHKGESNNIPSSLESSIAWFLCATAVKRKWGQKKPVSMLIHTSQKQNHHKYVSESIENWFNTTNVESILRLCRAVYQEETERFSINKFREGYPDYNTLNEDINKYPIFEDIQNNISELIKEISHIPLSEEGELDYHMGIHLCIDNCANNGINNDMHIRLAYPKIGAKNYPQKAPAFIVVGGSTLSRGLTIEGLVSTYFLRSSKQGDSLMQMGRWFGYRKGYELLPRVWMTEDTLEKFKFLASLEHELREDLKEYSELGYRPELCGPKLKNSPKLSWLKITAKNRMQSAIETDLDFSGISAQTTIFENNKEILEHNIKVSKEFLDSIGKPIPTSSKAGILWKDVNFESVKEKFLLQYNFNRKTRIFDPVETFIKWYEEVSEDARFTGWNVLLMGIGKVDDPNNDGWKIDNYNVGRIERTRKGYDANEKNVIAIGALRAPRDLYADIDEKDLVINNINRKDLTASAGRVREIREKVGLQNTPQLIIYRIKHDSTVNVKEDKNNEKTGVPRYDLNFIEDVIGISLTIPGQKNKNLAKKITIHIEDTAMDDFNESDLGGFE